MKKTTKKLKTNFLTSHSWNALFFMGIQLIKCRETFFRCLSILQAKLRTFVDDETQNFCRITVIKLRVTHCIANTRTCKNCCHAAKENLLGHCLKAKCSLFIPDTWTWNSFKSLKISPDKLYKLIYPCITIKLEIKLYPSSTYLNFVFVASAGSKTQPWNSENFSPCLSM